jgi:hypothetical protein
MEKVPEIIAKFSLHFVALPYLGKITMAHRQITISAIMEKL